ncbi:MAG: PQQ-binding-like beta-propeller repeat protein, partial [Vicinamibacteria bacterium]
MAPRLLFLSLVVTVSIAFGDWPQWRGRERTGVASVPAPAGWPESLSKVWQVPVGIGHSSPVIEGDRVFQFSREGGREVVRAMRLESGEALWEQSYEAPYDLNPAAASHGLGPKSTPLLSESRLFTLGIAGKLSAFDAASGRVLWQSDYSDRFETTSPLYGNAASPMIAKGKLLIHLGGPGKGALMALDPETGKTLWAYEGDGPGYSSPIVVDLQGVEQVVTQTDAHIVGVALDSGKLLWRIPFTTPYDQNVVTPVAHGARLIFSGLDSETFAVALERRNEGLEPREVWRSPTSFYMSTSVLVGDRLLGFSNLRKGQLVALDAKSGKSLWESEGRLGDNGALVLLGKWLLVLTSGGELIVLPSDASSFSPSRRYTVADSPTWA